MCISACGHASACDLHLLTSIVIKKGVSEESRKKRNTDGRMDRQMGRQLGWWADRPSYRDARIHLKIFWPRPSHIRRKQVEQLGVTMISETQWCQKSGCPINQRNVQQTVSEECSDLGTKLKKENKIKYMNMDLSDLLRCQNASLIDNDAEATL